MTADEVVYDELAAAKLMHVIEAVLPIAVMAGTSFTVLSTIKDTDNLHSKISNARRPDGSYIFDRISLSFICDDCINGLAKNDTDNAEHCLHMKPFMPPYHSNSSADDIKFINKAVGTGDKYAQESLNISFSLHERVFPLPYVEALRCSEPYRFPIGVFPKYVYIGFDPAPGGVTSRAGLHIGAYVNGLHVVSRYYYFILFLHGTYRTRNYTAVYSHDCLHASLKLFANSEKKDILKKHAAWKCMRASLMNRSIESELRGTTPL